MQRYLRVALLRTFTLLWTVLARGVSVRKCAAAGEAAGCNCLLLQLKTPGQLPQLPQPKVAMETKEAMEAKLLDGGDGGAGA